MRAFLLFVAGAWVCLAIWSAGWVQGWRVGSKR